MLLQGTSGRDLSLAHVHQPSQSNYTFLQFILAKKFAKMTTFTKIDGTEATIDIRGAKRISKIDDNIYGGFLE
jgi:hypothetical protein